MTDRLNPFELVFGAVAPTRFPALREGIRSAGREPRDRDGFVLVKEVVELLRELRPEDAPGDGLDELVAFTHASFLYWLEGECAIAVSRDTLTRLLDEPGRASGMPAGSAYYLALPELVVWGEAVAGASAEPLDGCFVIPRGETLEVVAIFGLQRNRDGFTVVRAAGPRPSRLARLDGTRLFSSRLAGGLAAGLYQLAGAEELVELVHRCHGLLPPAGATPGVSAVGVA